MFPCMRVQRRHTDLRLRDMKQLFQGLVRETNCLFDARLRQHCRQLFDRHMRRHEHDLEWPPDDHHAAFLSTSQIRQQFRMAWIMAAGHVDRFLVARSSHDAVDTAQLCQLDCFLYEGYRGATGLRCGDSHGESSERQVEWIENRHLAGSKRWGIMSGNRCNTELELQRCDRMLHHRNRPDYKRTAQPS